MVHRPVSFFCCLNQGRGSLSLRPAFMFTTSGSCHTSLPHALWCTNSLITISYLTLCPLSYQVKMPCPVGPPASKPAVLPSDLDSWVMWPDCALPPVDLWELTFFVTPCFCLSCQPDCQEVKGNSCCQLSPASCSSCCFLCLWWNTGWNPH